ncbi:hypothetical protein O181_095899 [Austropuccinia psidii MF-1]|uniref:Uncharacterized protein n=1 Tax=Austropuccinia psidii MF-1 TaxID=1389203 RepID=A0A9Q3J616_9BASI|nr:hypothetical protein [Austropuccinia psidii MF-1]
MRSCDRCFGSGFSDLIKVFYNEELEQLLFSYPSPSSNNLPLLDWAMTSASIPSSPPALVVLSPSPSESPTLDKIPNAAMAFYSFIEGEYNPRLFVPDPYHYFLKDHPSSSTKSKRKTVRQVSNKRISQHYFLCPHRLDRWAITSL